jgi:hypothetical protein
MATPFASFPFTSPPVRHRVLSPPVRHRVLSHFNWTLHRTYALRVRVVEIGRQFSELYTWNHVHVLLYLGSQSWNFRKNSDAVHLRHGRTMVLGSTQPLTEMSRVKVKVTPLLARLWPRAGWRYSSTLPRPRR